MFDIAYHSQDQPGVAAQAKDIARREEIPLRYLEQIFQDLKRAGLVTSKRGPKGGYALALPAEDVCVGDVIRAVEGPIVLTSITTFAGLTPLLTEGSLSAQFLIPMATSLAFGVAFATGISLFLVPASYLILEDLKRLVGSGAPEAEPVPSEPPGLTAIDGAAPRPRPRRLRGEG